LPNIFAEPLGDAIGRLNNSKVDLGLRFEYSFMARMEGLCVT